MLDEVWRDIPEFVGLYQVSNYGRVRALARKDPLGKNLQGGLRKLATDRDGYQHLILSKKSKQNQRKAHRLVLEAFAGPCPDGMQCRHIDGNPRNNHLSNLKWGTLSENQKDRNIHGTDHRGSKHYGAKLCELDVWLIRNVTGVTQKQIADFFGISFQNVSSIQNRKTWAHV